MILPGIGCVGGILRKSGHGAFATTATIALSSDNAGWGGYTILTYLPTGFFSTSGNFLRITYRPPSTGNNTPLNAVYVGHPGTAPNFDGTQVQQLFLGSGTKTLTVGGGDVVGDEIAYPFDKTKGLIIAMNMGATADMRTLDPSSGTQYYKAASAEASLTTKSGYSTLTRSTVVSLIEVAS